MPRRIWRRCSRCSRAAIAARIAPRLLLQCGLALHIAGRAAIHSRRASTLARAHAGQRPRARSGWRACGSSRRRPACGGPSHERFLGRHGARQRGARRRRRCGTRALAALERARARRAGQRRRCGCRQRASTSSRNSSCARRPRACWAAPSDDWLGARRCLRARRRGGRVGADRTHRASTARCEHLRRAAAMLAPLGVPAMRKDFLVDPYQVLEARAAGAGGVLVIVRMLSPRPHRRAAGRRGASIGLFVLLEAFDAADLATAREADAQAATAATRLLVGINCRDLADPEGGAGALRGLGAAAAAPAGRRWPRAASRRAADAQRMQQLGLSAGADRHRADGRAMTRRSCCGEIFARDADSANLNGYTPRHVDQDLRHHQCRCGRRGRRGQGRRHRLRVRAESAPGDAGPGGAAGGARAARASCASPWRSIRCR